MPRDSVKVWVRGPEEFNIRVKRELEAIGMERERIIET